MRLDVFLAEKGVYASRTRAARAVEEGCVKVNGNVIKKTSFDVTEKDNIETMADPVPFVSRGAFKLKHALECFDIDIHGVTAVDIGASTGGFTEIMLSAGAAKVFAVDVGKNQLAKVLREDERVVSMEETDIRNLPSMGYREYFEFGACDASFISLTSILPSAFEILKKGAKAVFLIKPQFEVGKRFVGKGGIVKDRKAIKDAVEKVSLCAQSCGFEVLAPIISSPVKGGDGNEEFLIFLGKR